MLSWYRNQVREHGALRATIWLLRVTWARETTLLVNRFLPARVACPCCGWEGRKFFDYIEVGYRVSNAACPRCDSHPRHRGLFLWLENSFRVGDHEGRALLFAPEKALSHLWQRSKLKVYRLDIEPARGVEVLADLMNLPVISNCADVIWCHHVLDQVVDDRRAIAELRRVLREKTGVLIVSVGMADLNATREFGFADRNLTGNRRTYGADFKERLREAGLNVTELNYGLSDGERKHFGVDNQPFFYCTTQ